MSMTDPTPVLKTESLHQRLTALASFVQTALQDGTALHKIELGIWQELLQLGHDLLEQLFTLAGDGDLGETVTLPNGEQLHRLDERTHAATCPSLASFSCSALCTAAAPDKTSPSCRWTIACSCPRASSPTCCRTGTSRCASRKHSARPAARWRRMLGLKQSVDSLEHMNQEMAENATTFMLNRPQPREGRRNRGRQRGRKGIVMRRQADDPAPKAHRTKGDKASQKRMATVATVYTVDRYRRTPEEVVAALFRDAPEPSRRPAAAATQGSVGQLGRAMTCRARERFGVRLDDRRILLRGRASRTSRWCSSRRPGGVVAGAAGVVARAR